MVDGELQSCVKYTPENRSKRRIVSNQIVVLLTEFPSVNDATTSRIKLFHLQKQVSAVGVVIGENARDAKR